MSLTAGAAESCLAAATTLPSLLPTMLLMLGLSVITVVEVVRVGTARAASPAIGKA